ncbi:protein split ends [Podospora aff. communis PSN243]|uniref:Protein split ends n=1 Tax=Podospora aff. communis PSN243 TaxID=3040156 RepID=A0AAV9GAL9_9PEZI|nr:protein split ends [Podospora aff. communis PSN243]
MDPRQQPPPPQHPFSRNAPSPFGRPNFPGSQPPSQPPYPNAGPHPSSSAPNYPDVHSRKPSDTPNYYPPSRQYPPEPGPMPPSSHSRHPSASSITSGQPMNRGMPPPNSPPQQHPPPGQGPAGHQIGGPYGLPPPRPPPVSVGPPNAFPRDRQLPALDSIPRTGSTGGSAMSISSMLGGPPPPPREPAPPSHYPQGPPQGVSGPPYSQSVHASPHMHPVGPPEYRPPYPQRPQTPPDNRHRMYDARDPRANTAGSPGGAYSTPEGVQRYGTPQAYAQRGPGMTAEQAREPGRIPVSAVPPRPNSQPKSFPNTVPPRPMEMNRPPPPPSEMYGRREELRPSGEYNPDHPIRVAKYEDDNRYMADRDRQERQERERQERERYEREMEVRERERRERTMSGGEPGRQHPHSLSDYARALEQIRPQPYNRGPDPRDQQGHWPRGPYEPSRGPAPYDPAGHHPGHREYPPATGGPPYNGHPSYGPSPAERHAQPPHPPHQPPPPHQHPIHHGPGHQGYDSPDRQRLGMMHHDRPQPHQHPHQQQPPPRNPEDSAVPPPSVAYGNPGGPMYESPRNRSMEEVSTPHGQQRGNHLLVVQEINRKGRISPLPQAVQGAQPQLAGPAREPGIKSEFGRMFIGIGTGVGNMSSPIAPGAQLPYGPAGLLRREDSDNAVPEPLGGDASVKGGREPNRGKRRKPKEEDIRGDEESTGRLTPVGGRAKKAKTHSHHHHHHHHHPHHHHVHDVGSSPALGGNTPFKHVKGSTPIPSPTAAFSKDFPTTHHHAVPRSASHFANNHQHAPAVRAPPPPPPSPPVVIPKPRQVSTSKAVLESVANLPRTHLGDVVYDPILQPARLQDKRTGRPPHSGYKSTPKPLPWDLIEGKINCTLTMKIGKEHLTAAAREEITSRRALWGTDVYTDDSDVIAACIHAGWIRGEWPEEVDVELLGLDEGFVVSDAKDVKARQQAAHNGPENILTEPPATGPMAVPENRDLHVTLLILPTLEKYASTTRFGIKSREFGGSDNLGKRTTHDGLSFMITELRWVTNGGASQNRLRGKARRERIRKALREVQLGPAWAGGARNATEPRETEAPKTAEKVGEISGAWWKHSSKPPSEGDKENQPLGSKKPEAPKAPEIKTTEAADPAENVAETGSADTESQSVEKEVEKDAGKGEETGKQANEADAVVEA